VRNLGKKTILLLLVALAALLVAGCGGGGDDTTESAPATTTEEPQKLSKAELIDEGDGICAETNAAVGALAGSETETSSSEQDEKVANLYTGMVERLQELGAPEGAETGYSEFMEAAEELAKVEGEAKLAAEREDIPALEEAKIEAAPQLEEFQERAADYGFEGCSEGPGAVTPAGSGATAPEAGEEPEGFEEEGGVEPEAEYVEPEYEEEAPPVEEAAPETGGEGGGAEVAPESAPESSGGTESGGVGPG
jgi:hypothetical protein